VSYVQTDATTTVIDPEIGATFSASLILPAAVNMTAANLTTPSGSIAMDVIAAIPPFLTNTFADTFATNATQAGLDQAYPAGNYTVQITATPPGNGTVMLTADYPPIPHIQNFAMIQAIDPAADFNLSWDADVGAGANDFISLFITEVQGSVVFQAPNQCATPPIALPVTATSIVVPKGTFTAGKSYNMELSFYHGVSRDVPITTDAKGTSALAKSTKLTLQTTGGTGALTAPKFTQVLRAANGMVQLQIACMSQRTLTLESTLDLKSWLPVLTTNAPGASLTVTVPAGPSTFFRAGQQ
jgi:hypothetical protein